MSVHATARRFAAERGVLSEVRRFVADEAMRHTFTRQVPDLQLAVTEACANSIVQSGTEEFRVSINAVGSCLEITVEDDGVYDQTIPVPEVDGIGPPRAAHDGRAPRRLLAATRDRAASGNRGSAREVEGLKPVSGHEG